MSLSRETVFPVLKPFEWGTEFGKHEGILDRVFQENGKPQAGPFVAYGFDLGDNIGYLQEGTLLPEVSIEEVKMQAFDNLRRKLSEVEWREMDYSDELPGLQVLALTGHFYAAEALLLEDKMQQAHERLAAKTLLACTPVRGVLLAASYNDTEQSAVEVFASVCYENYHSGQEESISPIIWALDSGKVRGFLDIRSN